MPKQWLCHTFYFKNFPAKFLESPSYWQNPVFMVKGYQMSLSHLSSSSFLTTLCIVDLTSIPSWKLSLFPPYISSVVRFLYLWCYHQILCWCCWNCYLCACYYILLTENNKKPKWLWIVNWWFVTDNHSELQILDIFVCK